MEKLEIIWKNGEREVIAPIFSIKELASEKMSKDIENEKIIIDIPKHLLKQQRRRD